MTSTATYSIAGMTCDHCVTAISEEIGKIPGVTSVTVDLHPGELSSVHVTSDEPMATALVSEAVDEAGYEIVVP